jgi:hypothetical protein
VTTTTTGSVFLSAADVERMTKRTRRPAQVRALQRKGFRAGEHFILAADGEPLVFRDRLDAAGKPAHLRQPAGHRWDRLTDPAAVIRLKPSRVA